MSLSPTTSKVKKGNGKEKTEMCYHFLQGNLCPFKPCKYAHSEQELKQKLYSDCCNDLEDALLYRSRVCFDFVSTGACPYNNRCPWIHDPRIAVKNKPERVLQVKPCGKEKGNPAAAVYDIIGWPRSASE